MIKFGIGEKKRYIILERLLLTLNHTNTQDFNCNWISEMRRKMKGEGSSSGVGSDNDIPNTQKRACRFGSTSKLLRLL